MAFALVVALLSPAAQEVTINLEDIDSGLTSPTGEYRWRDVADQLYSEDYRTNYNYTQANVDVTYHALASTLHGTLNATNLKPNFAYQLKLVGFPGIDGNECIGLAGRWWEEEWNGSEWANGHNLNNKGDGSSPNPNDSIYFARRDIADPTSPTGLQYRYTGYLVFDYFITDEDGNAILNFDADSSYHVLFTTSQRARTAADGPLKSTTFDADASAAYNDTGGDDYPVQTVSVFGEWERLPVGGVYLQPGDYLAQMMLSEESFHGSGGSFAGCWAAAMGADIQFTLAPESPTAPVVTDIPDQTIPEGDSFATINLDDYVSDVDNTNAEMTWTYAGNSELSVTITNRVANISVPNPNWNGGETITFTATDPEDQSDSDETTFTVTPVNDAPVVTDIPDQTIPEGDSFITINLDNYVSDVDNTDAEMTWTYTGNSELSVTIANRVATISVPNPDWNGGETITFTTTDPGGESDSDDATFTATPVNDAPVVSDIPDQTIPEGESFVTINLDDYVTDADNTDAEMTWTYSGNSELSVTIVDRVATISIPDPDWKGSETITFTATDPGDESDSDEATFTSSTPLLWVAPDDESIGLGDDIDIDVMIIANGVCGVEFDLDFDSTLLEVIDADGNPANGTQISVGSMWAGMDYWVIQNIVNDGTIEFGVFLLGHDYCPSNFDEGQVAQIRFHGIGAGVSPLNFNDVIVGGPEGTSIEPVFLEDGTLTIVEHGTIQGVVEVQGRPGDWDGADITVSGPGGPYNTTVTSADGTWSISGILAGDYDVEVEMSLYLDGEKTGVSVGAGGSTDVGQVKVLGGDCNDGDDIDIYDAIILGGAFDSVPGDPNWDVQADINDSGQVDIFDAILLGGNWNQSSPVPW